MSNGRGRHGSGAIALYGLLFVLAGVGSGQDADTADPRAVIERIRTQRLTRELQLSEAQAAALFPKLNEMQAVDDEFRLRRLEIIERIRTLIADSAGDAELARPLAEYDSLFTERAARQAEIMAGIKEVLTPVQRARYVIFQDEFEREIREMIREVKRLRPR